jgi:hypothetical protein
MNALASRCVPLGDGANIRATATGQAKMTRSKELNTETRELTDEQLETVAGGMPPALLILYAAMAIYNAIHPIHHK